MPSSWNRASKTLRVSGMMRCSNELALAILDNIRVGASCQKCQELIRILEFSASFLVSPPPTSGEGGRAGDWIHRQWPQSCLHHDTSTKTPEWWDLGRFWVGKYIHVPGGWHISTPQGPRLLHVGHFWSLSCVPFHLAIFVSFQINANLKNSTFLSSLNHCSNSWMLVGVVWEPVTL